MEDIIQHPCGDIPTSPSTSKPPTEPCSDHSPAEPYRDDPTQPYRDDPTPQPSTPYYNVPIPNTNTPQPQSHPHPHPYDLSLPPQYADDDVPLALLFYPLEAPPSYAVATRSSYPDTLIHYIRSRPADADEETGEEERPDDVRFGVERVFAAFIVVVLLLVVVGVLAWLAVGSGML